MTKFNEYSPSTFRLYFPLIIFCISLILVLTNIGLYYFGKYSDIHLLIANGITITVFLFILIYQIIHKRLIQYFKSLVLTFDIYSMLVIPKEINEFTGKAQINTISQMFNSYLHQSYGEYVENKLYICIRIPDNTTVAKLLDKDTLNKLRESISNKNTVYSFTGFERKGVYLISVGTK